MAKIIFLWFLLSHVLGDYYLQSPELAKAKMQNTNQLIKHSLIYGVAFFLNLIWLPDLTVVPMLLGIVILHGLIDSLKPELEKYFGAKTYFLDQALHLLVLVVAAFLLREKALPQLRWMEARTVIQATSAILMLLLMAKPTNLTIRHLLSDFSPSDKDTLEDESLLRGGRIIGTLERWLVYLLLLAQQWGAIGFIFAAKSIVRWKSISKDNTEYFLIGTLLSLLFVVTAYYLIYLL